MERNSNKNFVLFITLALLLFVGWVALPHWLGIAPQKPQEQKADEAKAEPKPPKEKPNEEVKPAPPPLAEEVARAARLAAQAALQQPRKQIHLGDDSSNLRALLDTRGGSVRQVILTKFQQADEYGRPEWLKDEKENPLLNEQGKKVPQPLELIRDDMNRESGSYLLYHFGPEQKGTEPLPTLGETEWVLVEENPRRVAFSTEIDGVRITKTFTLEAQDYHIGLEVKLERLALDGRTAPFRYQITSAHGLRIEGEWYTNVLRNALIGWKETKRDVFLRTLEEARAVNHRLGGNVVDATGGDKQIRYAGVTVQYFASMLVVDDQQEQQNFIARARATLEGAAMKGHITKVKDGKQEFVLTVEESAGFLSSRKVDYTFHLDHRLFTPLMLQEGMHVAVIYTTDEHDRRVVKDFRPPSQTEPLFYNDIIARMASEPLELKPGEPVTHKYVLYNGPVKARLLGQLGGDKAVPQELVDRYENTLHLNTITDYATYSFFDTIGWTWLLIKCTNLMHGVLWAMHTYIMPWSWGLCIIMLTVLVRGMMFPISRKQALNAQRMQEKMAKMKPELAKLQEKYKNDREAMGRAQMELYRKYGVNPLGSCWLVFLQMPIFLGLYYALQESIHFRLAPFWPWIENLAAPDMLFWWTDQIPWISQPSSYGGMIYLGPFFNLLPGIAVAFMIMQQSMMTPPAMDEQQEMQMKMMKYMMIIFGLMFYKVAAGLCIYFIASSLWGFAERKLLPKKNAGDAATPPADYKATFLDRLRKRVNGGSGTAAATTAISNTPTANGPAWAEAAADRRRNRRKRRGRDGAAAPAGPDGADDGARKARSWWDGIREWWAELLEKARKK